MHPHVLPPPLLLSLPLQRSCCPFLPVERALHSDHIALVSYCSLHCVFIMDLAAHLYKRQG